MAGLTPGTKGRAAQTGRPIMSLLDLLGRRWLLRILWELRDARLSFRELRERCDAMSPTVLNQRLREMREAGIVVLEEAGGYMLSRPGRQLLEALLPLQRWSEHWQKRMLKQAEEEKPARKTARATK
jgi:DNA-binding HxlR family transcriptional regulator